MFSPLRFIAIDIETMNLNKDQIEFESQFIKHHPNTKDEAKRAMQIQAKKNDLIKKGALTNSALIGCIGIWSQGMNPLVLHIFDFAGELEGIDHAKYEDEATMLDEFSNVINEGCDEQTVIVVANAFFDLPKLRYAAAIRNKVAIPNAIKPYSPNPVYDVLHVAGKHFMCSSSAEYNLSLDDLAKHFGFGEKAVSGKDIPDMISRGEYKEAITYNAIDALLTGRIYQGLTGLK